MITNDKSMNWIHINDPNYTLNNTMKFNISPEKHIHHIQLMYHLQLHQIPELYLIQLKQYQLQLFVVLKVSFLFILLMILHIYVNVQYILYHMIIKINIIYTMSITGICIICCYSNIIVMYIKLNIHYIISFIMYIRVQTQKQYHYRNFRCYETSEET